MGTSSKKACICNMWYGGNYGGICTALALCKLVESKGYKPTLLCPSNPYGQDASFAKELFASWGIETRDAFHSEEERAALNDEFDTFIVGSDQVWRYEYTGHLRGYHFFLDFVAPGKKKLAVAASIATEKCNAPSWWIHNASARLKLFDAISTREKQSVATLQEQFGVNAEFILDPVFLCNPDVWEKISTKVPDSGDDYLFSYVLDATPEKQAIVDRIAAKEKCTISHMTDSVLYSDKAPELSHWLSKIRHCKHVVTDSFHGVCFALIFKKPFTCIANHDRGFLRFSSILETCDLMSRILEPNATAVEIDAMPDINWNTANALLKTSREKSLTWIETALSAPPDRERINRELVQFQIYQLERHLEIAEAGDLKQLVCAAIMLPYLKKKYRILQIRTLFSFGKKRIRYKEEQRKIKLILRKARQAHHTIQRYLLNI